jgi:hypothetical protein
MVIDGKMGREMPRLTGKRDRTGREHQMAERDWTGNTGGENSDREHLWFQLPSHQPIPSSSFPVPAIDYMVDRCNDLMSDDLWTFFF